MGWDLGRTMVNDIADLHHKKNSRQYFDEFKKLLKNNGVKYKDIDRERTRAQVITIKKYAFYFVGSTTWWGIQKNPIDKLKEKYEVYIVLFSNTNDPHYWLIGPCKVENNDSQRCTFTETNKELNISKDLIYDNAKLEPIDSKNILDKIKEKVGE